MKNNILLIGNIFLLFGTLTYGAKAETVSGDSPIKPDATYMFAQRDTCDLYLDIYNPAPGSCLTADGKEKPTIIFAFGGSFARGSRDAENYLEWFRTMSENGYRIVSIDYRLGLKGYDKVGIFQVNALDNAIHIAVEDMVSATAFLIKNAEKLGINPDNIVISGSSAGAITALQTEYERCNRTRWVSELPDGFRYAGVMAFAGAILSRQGKPVYASEPAPTLLLHGTEDSVVPYRQIKIFRLGFFGSSKLAERFEKYGYVYSICRYKGHNHEIATAMYETVNEQLLFLESYVMHGSRTCVDALIANPAISFPED